MGLLQAAILLYCSGKFAFAGSCIADGFCGVEGTMVGLKVRVWQGVNYTNCGRNCNFCVHETSICELCKIAYINSRLDGSADPV